MFGISGLQTQTIQTALQTMVQIKACNDLSRNQSTSTFRFRNWFWYHCSSCCCSWSGDCLHKSIKLHCFKLDQDEISQKYSLSYLTCGVDACTKADTQRWGHSTGPRHKYILYISTHWLRVGLFIWCHYFKTATMTSFHGGSAVLPPSEWKWSICHACTQQGLSVPGLYFIYNYYYY